MKIRVNVPLLNVRMGPSKKYPINGKIKRDEVYTIIEERNGYGLLKSHAGWIDLSYTRTI